MPSPWWFYFETYYVAPERAGEHACALLFQALRQSGFVAIAQVAMHRREHVVVIRPGRTGIVLPTMFYEGEIRREDEHRSHAADVSDKELELALLLDLSAKNVVLLVGGRSTVEEMLHS